MEETVEDKPSSNRFQSLAKPAPKQKLSVIEAEDLPRISTGVDEFDRVLGGGLVTGGVALIGGDPGIGKSTLLLQALAKPDGLGVGNRNWDRWRRLHGQGPCGGHVCCRRRV
jgi:DNA repair protein RadA/Sms